VITFLVKVYCSIQERVRQCKCGGKLLKRQSVRTGVFLGCENFPNCGYTESLEKKKGGKK